MIRLVVIFGLAGSTEEVEINENDRLQEVFLCLHARKRLGRYTYIDFVRDAGQGRANPWVMNQNFSIGALGLQDGDRITAVVTTDDSRWELEANPRPFAYPCACGICSCGQVCGPNLLINFEAREPIARPGTKTWGREILEKMSKEHVFLWKHLADDAPNPLFEEGDIFEKWEQYFAEFRQC